MQTKTKINVAAEMEALGFPYESTHPAQMANMIATASAHSKALVATVESGPKSRVFVGYYSSDEAPAIAQKARRVRRMRVTSVVLLAGAEASF